MKTIYIAGGCFWGVEKYFSLAKGVVSTEVGYANGTKENPSYEDLKNHNDDAAETVKIVYNENIISLEKILELYLRIIDPYSLNKQGEDIGEQYRTGIYYVESDDSVVIRDYLESKLNKDYVVEILPLKSFYLAEEYHQKYLDRNPNGYCHVNLLNLKESERK